jgi:hypothetical protein
VRIHRGKEGMQNRLRHIKEKLGIPSGRAIIHIVVVEIIITTIWYGVSKLISTPSIREIGFLVIFIAGLFAVAWYLPKLTPGIIPWSKRKGYNEDDVESIRYGNILRNMMKEDIDKLDICLSVVFRRVMIDHIGDKAGPYLVFVFSVHSSSVYRMQFNKEPRGHLIYEGQELKDEPEFVPGSWISQKPTLLRKSSGTIDLRQFLLPEIASHITDMSGIKTKQVSFECSQIVIPVDVINPNGNVETTWRCPLPNKFTFTLPADG